MPTTIVTGGAGFLGSHLVDRLLANGERVMVVDNLSTGRLLNIEQALELPAASFVFLDVAQPVDRLRPALVDALAGDSIEMIYHLASPASPDAYSADPWGTLGVNGTGTMSLIEIALEHGAKFLFSSTSEIYGDPLVHPQPESYFGNVDPIGPRACYDEGKRFAEAAVSVAVRSKGLDGRLVRFFNCYGPRMAESDGRLIAGLATAAAAGVPLPIHGNGQQTRSMTYIGDAVELLMLVADRPQATLQPVNIGSDHERSVLEIAEIFARVAGVPFDVEFKPGRPGDPQRRRPELSIARGMGWTAKTSLEDGLRITVDWLRSHALSSV